MTSTAASSQAPAPDAVAAEVRAWLAECWDPDLTLADWRDLLADSGWGAPTWPTHWWGRGLPAAMTAIVEREFDRVGAVGPPEGSGMGLAAPTILEHGSDDVKARLLRPIVTGEHTWCQLFSEPGNGSDLAGLVTRAERDGDEWVVNGQKVWTTSAHHARYGMLLARTDWDVPKHRGITYFAFPMEQPGVEVRPLRQMNGHASFNEVFLTDARVTAANVIGRVGDGWTVAHTTLAHERRLFSGLRGRSASWGSGRAVREAELEIAATLEPYKWYPQRAGRPDLVADRARATGRSSDPLVRQEVARLVAMTRAAQWTAQRARMARALGRPPGPEGSIGKLGASSIARAAARAHALIAGASGMLAGSDGPLDGLVTEVLVSVPAVSIAGGTDEIQRNIIGERVLGLPREPQVDAEVPFREVPRNVAGPRRG
ncbi:MAG TPA: acyl-CoA dehydrogenase family protein [Acidimicrobiales bacterium]|nr:acyl-CoA dehydrogenase family protein [Acidimicrobiales bacterium]